MMTALTTAGCKDEQTAGPAAAGSGSTAASANNKHASFFKIEMLKRLGRVFQVKDNPAEPVSGLWQMDLEWFKAQMQEKLKQKYKSTDQAALDTLLQKVVQTRSYLTFHNDDKSFFMLTVPPNMRIGGTRGTWQRQSGGQYSASPEGAPIKYSISVKNNRLEMRNQSQLLKYVRITPQAAALHKDYRERLTNMVNQKSPGGP